VLGVRDLVWAVGICMALTWVVQWRPSWSARRFIERESRAGFETAFAGHRFANGEIVTSNGSAQTDPTVPAITFYRLEVDAEELNWNGSRAEFVVRHRIELEGRDASQDVHLRLEKRGSQWNYTHFEVRGHPPLEDPSADNPWSRTLHPDAESL
jgi:hypothetical protein